MKVIRHLSLILLVIPLFSSFLIGQSNITCHLSIDVDYIEKNLNDAKPIFSGVKFDEKPTLLFPLYDGTETEFTYESASVMHPNMQANYPEIKSYFLQSVENPALQARVNISPAGLFAIFKEHGDITKISKNSISVSGNDYIGAKITSKELNCKEIANQLPELGDLPQNFSSSSASTCFENGAFLRTYRLAFSPTYEYTVEFGPSLSAINAQIANDIAGINLIYESEMAITFQLAVSNNVLVNLILGSANANSDPYSDPFNVSTSLNEGGVFIENNMNIADYDLGHSFHYTSGGAAAGLAGIGIVCGDASGGNFKSRGYSILRSSNFEDYILSAHEFGHMFSCRHTGYGCGTGSSCQRYETGQGLTIMSTSAGCGAADQYESRTNYFSVGSMQAIIDFVENGDVLFDNASCTPSSTSRGQCAATTVTGNTVPNANANPNNGNYTIPANTPFLLEGEGTDADGDALTYSWEEYDTDYSGTLAPDNAGGSGTTTDPLFRSFPPTTNNTRVCPQISSVLAGNTTTGTGEDLPNETRDMNWRFVVRDNFAGASAISCDEISVGVDASTGPFIVTSQNNATTWVADGSNTATINWNVAGTTGGNVNCANVDIQFSTDGGNTFTYTLVSSTANDGSETIIIPSYPTNIGRIRIICSDNIFFDINNSNIEISSTCLANGGNVTPETSVSEDAGNANLNLSLQPNFGAALASPISGILETSDPIQNVSGVFSTNGQCATFTNTTYYDTYEFVVDVSGNYTFSSSSGFGFLFNMYENSFNTANGCTNIIHSGFDPATSQFNSNPTLNLTAGITYVIVAQGFNIATNQPVIPASYSISYTGPGGLFTGTPPPGAGFSYTYVIVDENGNIAGFEANSDLSNSSTYAGTTSGSTYQVFGLSYANGTNLNSYTGNSFSSFASDLSLLVICGNLSVNKVDVTITGTSSCPATLNFSSAVLIPAGLYQADDIITAKGWVNGNSGGEVIFQAGAKNDGSEYILLNSPFNAITTFTAQTIDCDANDN